MVDSGEIESFSNGITVRNTYDIETNTFRSRFSINLQETGTFFLANTRFSVNDFSEIVISGGVYELGFIEILSSIENANQDGGYQFVVTE